MKKIIVIFFFLSLGISANVYSAELEFIFDWSDLKKCTTGNPNRVTNPIFYLNNIPKNTKYIQFSLSDRDATGYNHGGGKVDISEIKVIKELFKPLCIEWKSHLQLEWAPFLWNFFNDLNLFLQIKEGKNKKKLEAWASQRYSNLLFETIFSESDQGE